jgi:co-chaperonin GroES (HSP10)
METMSRTETLEEKEKRLDELAQEIYHGHQKIIIPVWPWVVVRIMPKEQQFGSILLPEKQNKLFYEGIVLAVWKPFWRHYSGSLKFDEEIGSGGRVVNKSILVESAVEIGDRVMFMHFEGQPVPWLDEKNYRMIHEFETHPNGGIWGTIETEQDRGLRDKLDKLFRNHTSVTISGK